MILPLRAVILPDLGLARRPVKFGPVKPQSPAPGTDIVFFVLFGEKMRFQANVASRADGLPWDKRILRAAGAERADLIFDADPFTAMLTGLGFRAGLHAKTDSLLEPQTMALHGLLRGFHLIGP